MAKYRITQKVINFAYPKPIVEYIIEKKTIFGWIDVFGDRPGEWKTHNINEANYTLDLLIKNTKWANKEVIRR